MEKKLTKEDILCYKCTGFFDMTIKNNTGGSGDRHVTKCLINDTAFKDTVKGQWTDDNYPKVIKCNNFLRREDLK